MGTPASGRALRRQGQKTLGRLLDAATEVLAERGYPGARVDDIVRRAKTSHGTFYLYFSNKDDLFRALAEECIGEMTGLAESLGPIDAGAAGRTELRRWLGEFFVTYRRYGAVIRAWMEAHVAERDLLDLGMGAFADIRASFVERLGEAEGRAGRDDALDGAALLAMIERFAYFVTTREFGYEDEAMLDTLAGVIHRGFFAGT